MPSKEILGVSLAHIKGSFLIATAVVVPAMYKFVGGKDGQSSACEWNELQKFICKFQKTSAIYWDEVPELTHKELILNF